MPRYLLLIVCTCLACAAWGAQSPYKMQGSADLNGDGKAEAIAITWKTDQPSFTLQVGAVKLMVPVGSAGGYVEGFRVVDIDTRDNAKELEILATDDPVIPEFKLFSYDGKAIYALGTINNDDDAIDYPGAGFLYAKVWGGFWMRMFKYTLDAKAHRLSEVPQPFFYVGAEGTVQRSLPIYAKQEKKAVVANLLAKSKVLILLEQDQWYLVKSTSGLVGWLPYADVTEENFPDLNWGG